MADEYDMKLPTRWLKCRWVERFSSVEYSSSDGSPKLTASPIHSPDLFQWIKSVHYPQLTGKQFRQALRDLCKDKRAGYKASPLPDELRKLLNKQMKKKGKLPWAHQQNIPHAGAQAKQAPVVVAPVASTASERSFGTNSLPAQHLLPSAKLQSIHDSVAYPSVHTSAWKTSLHGQDDGSSNINQHSQSDTLTVSSSLSAARFNTEQSLEPMPKRMAMGGTQTRMPIEFSVMQPCANDESNEDHSGKEHENMQISPTENLSHQLQDEMTTAPESSEGFSQVFDEITESLHDFGLVSKADYLKMEKHFTSCFSGPVAFSVYSTNRTLTWRPMPYTNQQCYDILGVDMSSDTQHVVNDISTIECARDLMSTWISSDLILISNVCVNCIDQFGKPIRKLVDLWMPPVKFNQDEAVTIMALHNTVTLRRQPGSYPPENWGCD